MNDPAIIYGTIDALAFAAGAALCAKGRAAPELVHSPRRLTQPLRRTRPKTDPDPGWREITWDEALTEIADRVDTIRREDGHTIASFDPYFQVPMPSRYYDPDAAALVGRPMNMCYATESNGDMARGGACATATGSGAIPGITWDDPRSPFNGVQRKVDINGNRISNGSGPAVWYTDPYGLHGRAESFPGSVRQVISVVNTALNPHGPTIGQGRNYGAPGVRAPN